MRTNLDESEEVDLQPNTDKVYKRQPHLTIKRVRCGKQGTYYRYSSGKKVTGQRVLRRIERLVIPPNWREVYISKDPSESVQAIGVDAKGRRQYLYHEKWHKQQQAEKFAKLAHFGKNIAQFRSRCKRLLDANIWNKDRACALACLLLDHTGVRIGNPQYSKQNDTYGLTTLRRKHVQKASDKYVELRYAGKHHKTRIIHIDDPMLASLVCECAESQGYTLFRYQLDDKTWQDITSDDVNEFIHLHMGNEFSCKDFRTWAGSRYAVDSLIDVDEKVTQGRNRKWATTLSKHVAKLLGNTPSVCKAYYIHPNIFKYVENTTLRTRLLENVVQIHARNDTSDNHTHYVEKLLMTIIES